MEWIGVDGEGIGRAPHNYVMLCANNANGDRADYIEDVNGLSTVDCLDFFLDSPAFKSTKAKPVRVCGYYLTYDWTKILKDLPNEAVYRLMRPELRIRPGEEGGGFSPVRWRGYSLHYLAGMMRISRGRGKMKRSVVVWDVGKFYQSRFTAALESSGLAPTELITRMKAERGSEAWGEDMLDTMRDYCLEECQYLARLVALLEAQHTAIGLKPKAWHGPGSTAGTLLKKHKVENHLAPVPPLVQRAAECAYFGGRFEHSIIGTREGVWAYDIRSAYPWAASSLPCLKCARWVQQKKLPQEGEVALIRYRVKDIGERVWGPLPCRLEDGSIVWSAGEHSGWAWSVEFWPAVKHWKGVEFLKEAWVLKPGCDHKPFDFLHELYAWRVSRPENKQVVKLAINSVYGKLAQTVGGGKYASRVYAGIITASCRARMLELIARHADESKLLAIATDGAYSTEVHDIGGPGLGEWECEEEGRMTFLRPGIYWSDEKVRARGVGRRQLMQQLDAALAAIETRAESVKLGHSTQFGNLRECVYKTPAGAVKRSQAFGEWLEMPVSLSLRPEPKRSADWTPPRLPRGTVSQPYSKSRTSKDAKALQLIGSLLEGRLA